MGKKFTNVETYLIVTFLFLILVVSLILVGNEFLLNSNANPDNDSINYIAELQGVDLTNYDITRSEIEEPILVTDNESQGNPKDQALEFLFAKEKGFKIELVAKGIFSLPQVIIEDLFRFDIGNWNWIINIFNWLYRLLIVVAIVYFARGILS